MQIATYCDYDTLRTLIAVCKSWEPLISPLLQLATMHVQFRNPSYDAVNVYSFVTCLGDNTYFAMKYNTVTRTDRILIENTKREVVKDFGDSDDSSFCGLSTICYYKPSILYLCYRKLRHFSLVTGKLEKTVELERPADSVHMNDDIRFKTGVDGDNLLCLWWSTSIAYFHDVNSGSVTGMLFKLDCSHLTRVSNFNCIV